jgi:LysM repeat protein
MAPDPLFEAELEQVLASHYRPKTKWTLRFAQVSSMIGWIALIGLTLFLLSWRDAANQPTTNQATARPPSQQVRETVVTKITSTPRRPTASPTATGIPLQEYTVQAGDTCTSIANKFGLTIDLLTTLNRLNNTCDIWADQKLKVPIAPITTPSS